jgi:uncharacterized protein (TIGR00299 family) protein
VDNKILYIEAPDGISGDMVLGALIDLGVDPGAIRRELDKLIQGEYALLPHKFERNGIHGINLEVRASEEAHVHRHYKDIKGMTLSSGVSKTAKSHALAIFNEIADAEAVVHNVKTEDVQFHEVGAMDSIIDIVGTAVAIELLGNVEIYCSAVHDGSGTIDSRHGTIPVPVPAVMEMAKGTEIPIVIENDVKTEMVTPTGFGIIKGLRAKFEPKLGLIPEKTGYGFGKRDTGRMGAVRVTLGEKYEDPKEIQ